MNFNSTLGPQRKLNDVIPYSCQTHFDAGLWQTTDYSVHHVLSFCDLEKLMINDTLMIVKKIHVSKDAHKTIQLYLLADFLISGAKGSIKFKSRLSQLMRMLQVIV